MSGISDRVDLTQATPRKTKTLNSSLVATMPMLWAPLLWKFLQSWKADVRPDIPVYEPPYNFASTGPVGCVVFSKADFKAWLLSDDLMMTDSTAAKHAQAAYSYLHRCSKPMGNRFPNQQLLAEAASHPGRLVKAFLLSAETWNKIFRSSSASSASSSSSTASSATSTTSTTSSTKRSLPPQPSSSLEGASKRQKNIQGTATTTSTASSSSTGGPKQYAAALFPLLEPAVYHAKELARFLALRRVYPELALSPSGIVDASWHALILDTRLHAQVTEGPLGGEMVHHDPAGADDDLAVWAERYERTRMKYQLVWGHAPPVDVWPLDWTQARRLTSFPGRRIVSTAVTESRPGQGRYIQVRVVAQDSSEVHFKFRVDTPLKWLMKAWCQRHGCTLQNARFMLDGDKLQYGMTAEAAGLEDGDEIDVMINQVGC